MCTSVSHLVLERSSLGFQKVVHCSWAAESLVYIDNLLVDHLVTENQIKTTELFLHGPLIVILAIVMLGSEILIAAYLA